MTYALARLLTFVLSIFPLRWICALGRGAGKTVFALDRRHSRLAISHLRLAFPDCPQARQNPSVDPDSRREVGGQAQLRSIARRLFANLGEGFLEFLTYHNASLEYCLSHCETLNEEVVHEIMKRGKGLIFLTAHYGNWELLGILGRAVLKDYDSCAVGRSSGNAALDRFVQEIREVSGLRVLPKKGGLRNVLDYLGRGQIACFLADQIAGAEGVPVRFFNRPTTAVPTPAHLSLKTGAPIVPVFIERVRSGHHRIVYCDPIEPRSTGNLKADVQRITQQGMDVLEEFVRRRPDHWFWVHKRWKSKKAKKCFQDTYRIVVFSPHWIGDAVMSLPAMASLRRIFPNAVMDVAYPEALSALYAGIEGVDRRIPYGWTPEGFTLTQRYRFVRRLREGTYDMALLFPNSFDSALLAWLGGIRHRIGYAAHGRSFLLTCALGRDVTGGHHAQRYHRLIEALGDVEAQGLPPFAISQQDCTWARDVLGRARGKARVAIHPGATYGPAKRWFPQRFVELARLLAQRQDTQVILLGSQKEKLALAPFSRGMDVADVNDMMGKTDLARLIALISQVDVLVANDSGPMHLASLVGTPTVAIFGSTDPSATAPLGAHAVVRKPLPCSPCLKRTCANTAHPYECMERVEVRDVLEKSEELLRNKTHNSLERALRVI